MNRDILAAYKKASLLVDQGKPGQEILEALRDGKITRSNAVTIMTGLGYVVADGDNPNDVRISTKPVSEPSEIDRLLANRLDLPSVDWTGYVE